MVWLALRGAWDLVGFSMMVGKLCGAKLPIGELCAVTAVQAVQTMLEK